MGSKALMTRRRYLILKALDRGAGLFTAQEAVASVAMEHPEWDMNEIKTWDEWERGE